jgi:hypothetical protein
VSVCRTWTDKRSDDNQIVEALKGIALKHWNNNGGALAVSHGAHTCRYITIRVLYPQAFPWLFPYGLGGIGSTALSDKAHIRHLLMYHDKRFQHDVRSLLLLLAINK